MKSVFALFYLTLLSVLPAAYGFDANAPFVREWDLEMDHAKSFVAPPQLSLQTTTITRIHELNPQTKKYEPIKIAMPNGADFCEVLPLKEMELSKEPLENYYLPKDADYSLVKKVSTNVSLTQYKTIDFPLDKDITIHCKFLRKEDLAAVEMDKKSCEKQNGVPGRTYRPGILLRSMVEFDSELMKYSNVESCVVKAKQTSFAQMQNAFYQKLGVRLKYKEFQATSQAKPVAMPPASGFQNSKSTR